MQAKTLKHGKFTYDEEKNTFTITDKEGNEAKLSKVYAYAFQRFLISISQKWKPIVKKSTIAKAKTPNKAKKETEEDDPRQMQLSFESDCSPDLKQTKTRLSELGLLEDE